jgi:hypothetical protein
MQMFRTRCQTANSMCYKIRTPLVNFSELDFQAAGEFEPAKEWLLHRDLAVPKQAKAEYARLYSTSLQFSGTLF